MYNNLDLNALTIEDIVEEYKLLHERHERLKERSEEDAQRLHELKRSLDTSLAAERYLTQELEHLSAQTQASGPTPEPRVQQELEELRRKYKNLQLEHETLQQDYDAKVEDVVSLKAKLESAVRDLESFALVKANSVDDEITSRFNAMELENAELMHKLAEYEEIKVKNTFAIAEQEKTIEMLKDQIDCLEQNLRSKRDELEEKLQVLESTQEQLVDANAKIAMLSSAPEHNDRKGNSLFAEVDDQRQVMKHLLASQKKSYLDMKKIFNESKFEIHRLKRENAAMHTELQACSTIFCSADKTYQNKLNERIRKLLQQNAKLEHNLNVTQERLRELARQKSVTWLDSMLDFCKRETDELKTQLHSMHIQNATLEEQLRNMQQDMARWRFESLKSRCVLIDRENLLMEHKIAFKPMKAMEFDIKEAEIKAALPRIASVPAAPANVTTKAEFIVVDTLLKPPAVCVNVQTDVILLDTPLKAEPEAVPRPAIKYAQLSCPIKVKRELIEQPSTENSAQEQQLEQIECKTEPEQTDVIEPLSASSPLISTPPVAHIRVKSEQQLMSPEMESDGARAELPSLPAKPQRKGTPIQLRQMKAKIDDDEEQDQAPTPAKPQRKGTPVKTKQEPLEFHEICEAKPLRKGTPVRVKASAMDTEAAGHGAVRSILTKKRDLFAEDNQKNVQFSSSAPIVHNLSPDVCSPPPCGKENALSQDVKPVKKSQGIIRRIVVPSKKPASS
ncbi:PREDICTED: protein Spindly [Drosophila arizonae]|uniref:Protein Spindly n=1 Tax=Drosophila arizonae TaxID=7263 RepID=A0ABM1NUR2_DROAR|nr:PREDICTED: protein Spindly [Drosophila arizonae]